MIRLMDLLIESKADEIESKIRQSFLMNRGSFNTGWKMPKRTYIGLIKRLKKQYGSLVDKIVKELEKFDYIEPRGSQVVWNDGIKVTGSILNEGVNDPGIFKAVFLAGGPGSGKTYVSKQLFGIPEGGANVSVGGLKSVNSDKEFMMLLRKYDFDPTMLAAYEKTDKDLFHHLSAPAKKGGSGLRDFAQDLKNQRKKGYMKGKLGMIIDGTGHKFQKVKAEKKELEAAGYDTYMVFVNTSLEVAQARNKERDRVLPEKILKKSWNDTRKNLGAYKALFGGKFALVDNSQYLDADEARHKFGSLVKNYIQQWSTEPIKNPIGQKWVQDQFKLKKAGIK